jgi:hypothetical protein
MIKWLVIPVLCLAFAVSCGKNDNNNGGSVNNPTLTSAMIEGFWVLNETKSKGYSTSFLAKKFQAGKYSYVNVSKRTRFSCEIEYQLKANKIILLNPGRCNVGNNEFEVSNVSDKELKIYLGPDAYVTYDKASSENDAWSMINLRF